MSPRLEEFPACRYCGGKLFPLVLCDTCGAASILHDANQLDWATACPDCGTFNPWQLICDQCHSRFPAPGAAPEPPAAPPSEPASAPVPDPAKGQPAASDHPVPAAAEGRPKRHIRGEFDTTALLDMLKVLGLDPARSRALIDRGYNALFKIARAKETELARIPEVGPLAARKIFASFHLLKYSPPQRTKESIAQDVYECPLCGCLTSAFARSCLECGAAFDEEEMDEDIRKQFAEQGDDEILAFYDGRLSDAPDDPDLLYARGLLLDSLNRVDEAIECLDRAAAKAPDAKKIKVARFRIQARQGNKPEEAEKLRSTASALLDDVAWDQEVAELDHLISKAGSVCANCSANLPEGADRCPSCGESVRGAPKAPTPAAPPLLANPELDTLVDDLLVGELEESLSPEELEGTKTAVLDWLIQELEESIRPDEQVAPSQAEAKPEKVLSEASPIASTVDFLSGWMRGGRGLVSNLHPPFGKRGTPGKVNGLVNGMVNGTGRVNGLINGVGRINGLVNGVGRVNGLVRSSGRVNGLAAAKGRVNGLDTGTRFARSGRRIVGLPRPFRRVRSAAIAAGTLVAITIFAILFVPVPGPKAPITIDGSFADWASVPMYDAATSTADLNVQISRYASVLDDQNLYLFARMSGSTFGDSVGYSGVDFLIDADGNASTGFPFDGVGADYVVEIYGINATLASAVLYSFPSAAGLNWSARVGGLPIPAAANANGIELAVPRADLSTFTTTGYRVAVYADNFRGATSRSEVALAPTDGVVLLDSVRLTSVVGPNRTDFLDLRVRAVGAIPAGLTWTVSSFQLGTTPGLITSLSAESVNLTRAQPDANVRVAVQVPGYLPGAVVAVNVVGAIAPVPVFTQGGPARAYFLAPPQGIRIDGLFADWTPYDRNYTSPTPVNDSNVAIVRYGAVVNGTAVLFHVGVAGDLLAGSMPIRFTYPPPSRGSGNGSSGLIVPLARITGEDVLRVYVQLNASIAKGPSVDGISADYLLEVKGSAGRVTSRVLYRWSSGWTPVSSPRLALARDATDIEGLVGVGPTTNVTRIVIEMTDWAGIGDSTGAFTAALIPPTPPVGTFIVVGMPEFEDIMWPISGTLALLLFAGYRRKRRLERAATTPCTSRVCRHRFRNRGWKTCIRTTAPELRPPSR